MPRRLPSPEETARILAERRTRPARRPPPPAGKALTKYIRELEGRFGESGPGPQALSRNWREVVGEVLARRTEPVKLVRPRRGGPAILEIRVEGPAAAVVQHQAPDILARANLLLGDNAVDKLRIVQGPVRTQAGRDAAGASAAAKRRKAATPLDAASEATLAESLSNAPEGPLKASLQKLGRAVLRES
jgi:hypothetical protein